MNSMLVGFLVFVVVFGAAMVGIRLGALLPGVHLASESKDTVRLAMGLVATMTALILGLLVASAKEAYDAQKKLVTQMTAKVAFLDRLLAVYGPEAAECRAVLRQAVARAMGRIWPDDKSVPVRLGPDTATGAALYDAMNRLTPGTDSQRALKTQVFSTATDLGQMQWLVFEQASTSISRPLFVMVIMWLAILFLSFGLFAPSNSTVVGALMIASLSVSAALFLILELDRPFGGLIAISREPMQHTLDYLGQ